jgi:hypothetical protein
MDVIIISNLVNFETVRYPGAPRGPSPFALFFEGIDRASTYWLPSADESTDKTADETAELRIERRHRDCRRIRGKPSGEEVRRCN